MEVNKVGKALSHHTFGKFEVQTGPWRMFIQVSSTELDSILAVGWVVGRCGKRIRKPSFLARL